MSSLPAGLLWRGDWHLVGITDYSSKAALFATSTVSLRLWCANRHLEIRLYKFRAFIAEDKDAGLWYSPRFDPSDTRAVVFLVSLEVTLKPGFGS